MLGQQREVSLKITQHQISLHHIITILPAGSLENKLSKRVTLPRVQAELFSALGAGASVAGKGVLPMSTVILRDLFCLQEVSKLPNKLTCDFETDRSQSLQNQYTEIIGWQGANSPGNGDFSIRYELLWYTFNHRLSQIIPSPSHQSLHCAPMLRVRHHLEAPLQ